MRVQCSTKACCMVCCRMDTESCSSWRTPCTREPLPSRRSRTDSISRSPIFLIEFMFFFCLNLTIKELNSNKPSFWVFVGVFDESPGNVGRRWRTAVGIAGQDGTRDDHLNRGALVSSLSLEQFSYSISGHVYLFFVSIVKQILSFAFDIVLLYLPTVEKAHDAPHSSWSLMRSRLLFSMKGSSRKSYRSMIGSGSIMSGRWILYGKRVPRRCS